MSQRPQIPAIQGVDASVEKILTPTKQIIEEITGRFPNKGQIKSLGSSPSFGGVVNKVNEVIARLQGNEYTQQLVSGTSLGVPAGSGMSVGNNSGDQTITLSGEAFGTGSGLIVTTLAKNGVVIGDVLGTGFAGTTTVSVTLGTSTVTNAKLATMTASSIKGNNAASASNPADLTVDQVAAMFHSPQITVYTSASGTYSTPANAKYLQVEVVGGGGGGAGGGTGGGNGGAGGNSTFGTLTANGGGATSIQVNAGAAGTASGGDINIQGGSGDNGSATSGTATPGCSGGNSSLGGSGGGAGAGGSAQGASASINSGSGGGGGSVNANVSSGAGGSAGGTCRKMITSPAASYAYSVGAAGTAGTAGANGAAGGAGGAGLITVVAYFQ